MSSAHSVRQPLLFMGHGNPMLAISDNVYARQWQSLGKRLPKPAAILVVSAHWYGAGTAVTTSAWPETLHDFGGFPAALFDVNYPAPGSPDLALRVQGLLGPGTTVALDAQRGLDHGAWSVLRHLYPQADVPVVQLSMDAHRPASWHVQAGRQLAGLREEGVLILGSGNLVHHLGRINWNPESTAHPWAEEADLWLADKIRLRDVEALCNTGGFSPAVRLAVPSPDHFLPLLYVLGASHEHDQLSFPVSGIDLSSISMRSCLYESLA